MSDLLFFSETELPHQYLMRAAHVATDIGDDEMANLFYGFSDLWRPRCQGPSVVKATQATTWRDAEVTQTGRAALALATRYTDIQDNKEAK